MMIEENVGILQLEWVTSKTPYFVAALHGNGILLLWDTQSDTIVCRNSSLEKLYFIIF